MPQLIAPFTGQQQRTGRLAFGHANILRAITVDDDPTHLNLAMVFRTPEASLDRVVGLVGALLERHESLRTTYRLETVVTQQVAADGALPIEVIEAADDPLDTAESTARRYRATRFDLESELPLRVAIVTAGGAPRHLVWVVSHVAMDVASCELLLREWTALAAGDELPPSTALQPLDVVELERTPAIQRLGQAAERYWATQLRRVPQAMFTLSAKDNPPKTDWLHPGLSVRSTAAPAHLAAIAERTGASGSTIVLAAVKALVAHRTGHETCVTTSLSGNRVLRQLRDFFGSLAQDALLAVPVPDTFDDLVRAVRSAGVPAYRHSWFDPMAIWRVINGVSDERGIAFARDLVFNDMSAFAGTAVAAPERSARTRLPAVWVPGANELVANDTEPGASLTWQPAENIPCRFVTCLYRLDDEVELTLWVDPQVLSRDEVAEFGRALLRLLRVAADGDLPLKELPSLTTLAQVDRGAGWFLADSCWIELDAVRDLVAGVLGDQPHLVAAVPDEQLGTRLVCYVAGPVAAAQLHRRCLDVLWGRVTALAPHTYVSCDGAPGDPADPDAWAALPVLAEIDGRGGADT
ncbi:hypothetical protein F0L68_08170 [Solihabitans fulvus]|uniref:Condensation domain-containing protein n=1 Tax=Solihabitans fulvus TaxID=1892852 RepID=A0A5B2XM53_9PSEU|nr:condensation domain-containing protein [Solihabitans fulvus]KAA2264205.1 hypothetical protein F0L68_08170 [Solihabitans fulvus]